MTPNKIVHVPRAIAKLKIPGQAKDVLVFLKSLANKELRCWVRHSTVVKELGIAHVRSLRRSLGQLKDAGLLEILPQFNRNGGSQSCNFYQLSAFFWGDRNVLPSGRTEMSSPIKPLNAVSKTKTKSVYGHPSHTSGLPSAGGGGDKATPGTQTPAVPAPSTPLPTPPQPVFSEVQVLVRHWCDVFREKRRSASPVYAVMRCIFRDLNNTIGLAGGKAAIDLWFEKEYRYDYSTLKFPWAEMASVECYSPEAFEKSLFKITQNRRFAEYKAKHELIAEIGATGEKRESAPQEKNGPSGGIERESSVSGVVEEESDGEGIREIPGRDADEDVPAVVDDQVPSRLGDGFLR